MNTNIRETREKIEALLRENEMLETELGNAIVDAIMEVAKENPYAPKKLSGNTYVMKASDFIGKPWSPIYFDWEKSAEFIVDMLEGKPRNEWADILRDTLVKNANKDDKSVLYFKKPYTWRGERYCNNTPISREFIEKVIERIS